MKEVVVLSAVRSAIGGFNGSLGGFEPSELGGMVMKESIARASYATEPAQGDGSKGGAGLRGQADSGDESQSGAAPTVAGPVGPKDKPDKPSQTERERGFLQRLRGWLPLRANAW